MVQFIRLRGEFWVGVRALLQRRAWSHRVAAEISRREAARKVLNFAQPIILACIRNLRLSKIFRHSAGAWLNAHCAKIKINVD